MPFNFDIGDFNKLANAALNSPECDFKKSRVADRLQSVFANRNIRVDKSASLELRRNLADLINTIYNRDGQVRIPASVARALNVSKTASGFKLQSDGSLVATNHPLTDRRLVAIMTAIRLDRGELGQRCAELESMLDDLEPVEFAGSKGALKDFIVRKLQPITEAVREAGGRTVSPAALKAFMPMVKDGVNQVRNQLALFHVLFNPTVEDDAREYELLRTALAKAADIASCFGAQVAMLPGPILIAPPVVDSRDIVAVAAMVDNIEKQGPDPKEQMERHETLVLMKLNNAVGAEVTKLGLNVQSLVAFSKEEESLFEGADEDCAERIEAKVKSIVDGVRSILDTDLEDANKVAFLKKAIPADGAVDKAELETAVKADRVARYTEIATALKKTLEKDVSAKVLAAIVDDPNCKTGLDNLMKDFPMMKNFAKRVKADHQGNKLECFDLRKDGTLKAMLAGKLDGVRKSIDALIDGSKSLARFRSELENGIEEMTDAMVKRLAAVLSEPLFEDDRTILTEMALDPEKAEKFDEALKKARKTYDDNIFGRVVQSMMEGKVAVAQLKPKAKEASLPTREAFREIYHVKANVKTVEYAKDDYDRSSNRFQIGNQLKSSVRNLVADLFTAKGKDAPSVGVLLLENADTVQAMLLDPSLVDAIALPENGKGDAALRQLFRDFLNKISPNVNGGQLTPADFKDALKAEIKGSAHVDFVSGIAAAGRRVLADMQSHLTRSLTNVLKRLAGVGANLAIGEKTLAELGASGLGSFDEGYGKFLENVLDHYFTDKLLEADHNRMLDSLYRNGRAGGSVGEAIGALIKGAGPIFQKVLQSIPVDGLPEEIVKALTDVKSGLAPIPEGVIEARLKEAIAKNNGDKRRKQIRSIERLETLGAASVGQAIKCRVNYMKGLSEQVVIKFLRPGVEEIAKREQLFFRQMAKDVGTAMEQTFEARMAGIMEEFDFLKEKHWVEVGQCYGKSGNYGGIAKVDSDNRDSELQFGSMGLSDALPTQSDMIVLKVADGAPLDRCNQETRANLDAILKRMPNLEAPSGFDLVWTRDRLVSMYNGMSVRRDLLGELLRRFSGELFFRNFDGKEDGGGFMHGDLHGGNLLIGKGKMTVIDFGNSFDFNADERKQLVKFVASCGYSNAEIALAAMNDPILAKRRDYKQILKDVNEIISKGDANDVVSRGMAVVQYLQRKNVRVPGPIVNFTETVMRLSAAYDETNAIMDDIGGAISDLKLSPKADRLHDPFAAFAEELFLEKFDTTDLSDTGTSQTAPAARNFARTFCDDLWGMANKDPKTGKVIVPTKEIYDRSIAPMLKIMRNSMITMTNAEGEVVEVGAAARKLEEKIRLLGDELYKGGPIVTELMVELYRIVKLPYEAVLPMVQYKTKWEPSRGDSVNDCMSPAIGKLAKTHKSMMIGIVGKIAVSKMMVSNNAILEKAERTIARRQIASDAQTFLQRFSGRIEIKSRRIVDRFVRDHFLWTKGNPEDIFGSSRWYKNAKSFSSMIDVLKVNLSKLHDGMKAAGIKVTPLVENYAMIQFAFQHGLAQALAKLDDKSFKTLLDNVAGSGLESLLSFLRNDRSVVEAMAIGRVVETADGNGISYGALQKAYASAQVNFKHLAKPFDFDNPQTMKALVQTITYQYSVLRVKLVKEMEADDDDAKAMGEYAMMRHLLDEGFMQKLNSLRIGEPKKFDAVMKAFKDTKNKPVYNLMVSLVKCTTSRT